VRRNVVCAGSCAGCALRSALCQPLDGRADMIRAQVGVTLHHGLRLPAACALDCVKVHSRHRQS